jgi:hypothetical protein
MGHLRRDPEGFRPTKVIRTVSKQRELHHRAQLAEVELAHSKPEWSCPPAKGAADEFREGSKAMQFASRELDHDSL